MSCSSSDDASSEVKMQEMPIVITLPAEQFTNPHDFETSTGGDATTKASDGATRVDPGDPGTYESFSLPTHLYIFIYVKESESQDVFTYSHLVVNKSDWTKTVVGTDSVYRYNSSIPFDIPAQREEIKVYAAAWNRPLTLKKNGETTPFASSNDITKESDIQNMTFDLSTTDLDSLQNLYSSPYNYYVDGEYYGTMKDPESAQPNIDLMLYHVAAKLDLKWNVSEDVQSTVTVPYIGVSNLKNSGAFLFKPMDNTELGSSNTSLGETTNIGNQWYGRKSFYVIPYKDSSSGTFPVTLNLREKGVETTTIQINAFGNDNNIFTPWIRGNISVKGSNFK